MRRARRTDGNQKIIVACLRQAGCSVEVLSDVGRGLPDLLVARAGVNFLIEIKRPAARLNELEARWHLGWRGPVHVVQSTDEALAAVGAFGSALREARDEQAGR